MNKEELKKEFREYCNTDNFSAPPYETDIIADFWLSKLDAYKSSLLERIKNHASKLHAGDDLEGYETCYEIIHLINKTYEEQSP